MDHSHKLPSSHRDDSGVDSTGDGDVRRQKNQLDGLVRTAQLIRAAMIVGVAIITVVLAIVRDGEGDPAGDTERVFLMIGAVCGAATLVAGWFAPRLLASNHGSLPPASGNQLGIGIGATSSLPSTIRQAASMWLTSTIVSAAIFEGGAVINLVLWFLTGAWPLLAIAATLWLALVFTFPTSAGLTNALTGADA